MESHEEEISCVVEREAAHLNQQYVTKRRILCLFKDTPTNQPAPPFLIHPTLTAPCVPTPRFKSPLTYKSWVAQLYTLGARHTLS